MRTSFPQPAREVARPADVALPVRPPSLDALFAPRTVAVIGATEAEGSVGRAVMENLAAFPGAVHLVNPRHSHVLGRTAVASIADVLAPVDLAIIATPAATVPRIIGECAAARVASAVILSAGFKECGAEGLALEREIRARRGEMRVLGPNCLGVIAPAAQLNASFAATSPRAGSVAFLSQSGALCTAILDWSLSERVGFSAFVSMGSMVDVGWGDLIDHFGSDPHTRSIVCYMESVGDARAFLSAARAVAFTKPIIVIKVGHTEAASRAAASHTGALTGSDAVLDAAFHRAGVLRVNTIEELFDMAEVLGKQPRPSGPRLAIITNAGGPGALATDMLVTSGGQLAQLSPHTLAALNRHLPPAWSHGNPVDLLGAADADCYARAVELVLRDPECDGALVVLTPQAMTDPDATARELAAISVHARKPILASWMGGASLTDARETLNAAGIPTYDYPDEAARAFALMWSYSDRLRQLYERPALAKPDSTRMEQRHEITELLASIRSSGRTLLDEVESKRVLAAYGIPTVETVVAQTEDDALRAAHRLGWPVVLKVWSPTITHKTDVGGVKLDVRNAAGLRRAWREIERSVSARVGREHFRGVTVQPMVRRDGVELIVGSSVDPQFGPVLLFGAGGEWVEILEDRALALPPLNATLARRLIERTRIYRALLGARGRAPVNLDALADVLVAFSHLVSEQRWIAELDINPLLASAKQIVALDARVLLHPQTVTEADLPRLAIRPYPTEYVRVAPIAGGASVLLRPIRPEDESLLAAFHATLSEEAVHLRYFGQLSLERRVAHERLVRQCFADYDREIALVAEHDGRVVAVGRLMRRPHMRDAEFALVVADAWQERGLGTQILQALIDVARAEGLSALFGSVLPENRAMLHLCRRAGFEVSGGSGTGELHAHLKL